MRGTCSVPEVEPNFKTNQGYCGCGCGAYGTLKKPWPNGRRCIKVSCWCDQCRPSKEARRGYKEQRSRGAKRVAGKRGRKHEQDDRFEFRWEAKSDLRYAKPVFECYLRSFALALATGPLVVEATGKLKPYSLLIFRDDQIKQFCDGTYETHSGIHMPVFTSFEAMQRNAERERAIADNRPFIFWTSQSRMKFGLVVCRGDQLDDVRTALRLQHGWS